MLKSFQRESRVKVPHFPYLIWEPRTGKPSESLESGLRLQESRLVPPASLHGYPSLQPSLAPISPKRGKEEAPRALAGCGCGCCPATQKSKVLRARAPRPSDPLGAPVVGDSTAPGPGPASSPRPRAPAADARAPPRGASPACLGRTDAGTRAVRRTAPTPARAAPRWWLCAKRPRWCASGSRRWCGPGSTSRHGDRRPALFVWPCARAAAPRPAPAASPGGSASPRMLGERGRARGLLLQPARPPTPRRWKETGTRPRRLAQPQPHE